MSNTRVFKVLRRLGPIHFVGMDLNDPPIDFVGLAKSMGVEAVRVSTADDLRSAVAENMVSGKPNLIDAEVDGSL